MGKEILLAFIPLFVAVDAIGVLPIFVLLTEGVKRKDKRRIIVQSMGVALTLALAFIFAGKMIFKFLGIEMMDFMIAGGIILFCIAIIDLINPGKQRRLPVDGMGAVPLGTPLIAGPAVLTTSLMVLNQYGLFVTLVSVSINILFAGFLFYFSDGLLKVLGRAGAEALSKIMALLLGAIAVMMIRKGIFLIIATASGQV